MEKPDLTTRKARIGLWINSYLDYFNVVMVPADYFRLLRFEFEQIKRNNAAYIERLRTQNKEILELKRENAALRASRSAAE